MSVTVEVSPNLIGSERVAIGIDKTVRRNPADSREVVSVFPLVGADEIRAAVDAATDALPAWEALGAPARGEILYRAAEIIHGQAEELAVLITREEGKTLADSKAEVVRAVATLRFYGSCGRLISGHTLPSPRAETQIYTQRFPVGVVALITPWNFPLAIPCQKLAPALVAGNSVVLKPSSLTPGVALRLAEALLEAGVPTGVVNLVTAAGGLAGEALAGDPRVAAISFTGSSAVGAGIQRSASAIPRRTQLEMGGKNVCVVLADADIDAATSALARGCFSLTGQSCTATGLALIESRVYEQVVEGLSREAELLAVGPGLDPASEIGPAVNEDELQSTLDAVELGRSEGARLTAGGGRVEAGELRHGYFARPAVLADAAPTMQIAQYEIFGPVAVLTPISDLDEGLAIANASPYGLTASIFTGSLRRAHEFVRRAEVGIVKVNEPTIGLELHVPFGGVKQSSNDGIKELGTAALDFFTREKSVYVTEGSS
jgi:acyl-CoA reductase-like NAD-dependent aldehyde dehydrogenase